jgi:hypothetical protein
VHEGLGSLDGVVVVLLPGPHGVVARCVGQGKRAFGSDRVAITEDSRLCVSSATGGR